MYRQNVLKHFSCLTILVAGRTLAQMLENRSKSRESMEDPYGRTRLSGESAIYISVESKHSHHRWQCRLGRYTTGVLRHSWGLGIPASGVGSAGQGLAGICPEVAPC